MVDQASGYRLQEEGISGVWNWDHSTGIEFGLGRTEILLDSREACPRFRGNPEESPASPVGG